jgi:transcriptional regulator with XRE-family HTH domain
MARQWVTSPAYKTAVAILVEARTRAGLTQRELAVRLKRPPSFVAKIEIGERRLDLIEFIAIARALGEDDKAVFDRVSRALGVAELL